MNTNKKILVFLPVLGVLAIGLFATVSSVNAQSISASVSGGVGMQGGHRMGPGPMQIPGVAGQVTAVNGATISVQSMRSSSTIYTVDATNATVTKDNQSSTYSAIAVGDTIFARGTLSGTSLTATSIFDGKAMGQGMMRGARNGSSTSSSTFGHGGFGGMRPSGTASSSWHSSSTSPFNPANNVTGTVSAVSADSLTLAGSNGTTYTVDITNATLIKQGNSTNSISAINVGDTVQVTGTINGTSITATAVLDNVASTGAKSGGFVASIKSFFSNIFHFRF